VNSLALEDPVRPTGQCRSERAFCTRAGPLHDLRNLLAVVASGANLLRSPVEDDRLLNGIVDSIQQALGSVERLATDLLLDRPDGQPRALELTSVLSRWAPLYRSRLPANVLLRFEVRPAFAKVRVDPAALDAALLNLVLNSGEAMPSGGTLAIRLKRIGADVRLTVADTGIGMDKDTLRRAFLPFFTTKRRTGTGQGLPQVRRFAENSGGRLRARSRPGRGTLFTLDLPCLGSG
jgi:signal transduction histidine kinase